MTMRTISPFVGASNASCVTLRNSLRRPGSSLRPFACTRLTTESMNSGARHRLSCREINSSACESSHSGRARLIIDRIAFITLNSRPCCCATALSWAEVSIIDTDHRTVEVPPRSAMPVVQPPAHRCHQSRGDPPPWASQNSEQKECDEQNPTNHSFVLIPFKGRSPRTCRKSDNNSLRPC
jgi:hypothetical protein